MHYALCIMHSPVGHLRLMPFVEEGTLIDCRYPRHERGSPPVGIFVNPGRYRPIQSPDPQPTTNDQ